MQDLHNLNFSNYAVGVFEYQKNDLYLLILCMCTAINYKLTFN